MGRNSQYESLSERQLRHEDTAVAAVGALTAAGHILPIHVTGEDVRRGIKALAAERDALAERVRALESAMRTAADLMALNMEEDEWSISMNPSAALVLMIALGRDLPSGDAWDELVAEARALLAQTTKETTDGE